ncbi:MAG: hypothetical protein JM58_16035 [Peptococcaceae bacterium BICA1-8]|nr:MAG: hypothetical protein JM58_16035 [Peptococcaceae bacterium BICA1-8]
MKWSNWYYTLFVSVFIISLLIICPYISQAQEIIPNVESNNTIDFNETFFQANKISPLDFFHFWVAEPLESNDTLSNDNRLEKNIPDNANNQKVFDFGEPVNIFRISPDENYLAYYSLASKMLIITNLNEKKIIWQCSTDIPYFVWKPNIEGNILTYIYKKNAGFEILNLDIHTLAVSLLYQEFEDNSFVYDLSWSPKGTYLALIIITGLEDSHGYSQLKLFNNSGQNQNYKVIDLNYLDWSKDEKYLVYSKFTQADFSTSIVEFLNLENNNIVSILEEGIQVCPTFAPDGKHILYSTVNKLDPNIYYYNYINNQKEPIMLDLKSINNLAWLTEEDLLFTQGMKNIGIFNMYDKSYKFLAQGYVPTIFNNNIYYLKPDFEEQKTELFRYSNK